EQANACGDVDAEPPSEPLDLFTLLAQFTALRHDVNLQTRAVRAQQELTAQALRQIGAGQGTAAADPSIDSLLKSLIEVADVQILAAREMQRLALGVKESLDQRDSACSRPLVKPSLLGRILGLGRVHDQIRQVETELAGHFAPSQAGRIRDLIEAAAAGLTLGLQRIERAMRQHGLEPIAAVGPDFDPETMEAREATVDSGRKPRE